MQRGTTTQAYQGGTTEPFETNLTYSGTQTADLAVDVPLGTAGHVGQITVNNQG